VAINSKRELLILSDVAILEDISAIKTVTRTLLSYSDLKDDFALTQLPVCAVVGRLPVPTNHYDKRTGHPDFMVSSLNVDIYVYFQERVNMDSEMSSLLDDLWVALYADPSRGGLCITTTIELSEQSHQVWEPFVAFQLVVKHQYQHTPGGI
jgi:hypothetical protein